MNLSSKLFLFVLTILLFQLKTISAQEFVHVHGRITDRNDNPVSIVQVSVPNSKYGTVTDKNGSFSFRAPYKETLTIHISHLEFETIFEKITLNGRDDIELNKQLDFSIKELDEVWIKGNVNKGLNLSRIEIKDFNQLPNVTGNIESLLKIMGTGVSSNNELSSQYSVRGGNYDENLVYVNDIEIYRPFLVRSGQQEGLSFINPTLIRSIQFSAGGFSAVYGDKMSSVLDIHYKTPDSFGASFTASLLGASAHVEGASKNKKFTHISGYRYKTSEYMLNTLETKGEYNPRFSDFQTYLTYTPREKLTFGFLGNYSMNNYNFIPQTRESKFGTFREAKNIKIYYDGQENDKFETILGAFTTNYRPSEKLELKFISSAFKTSEYETFDIQGQYLINELDNVIGSETFGDSIKNIGIGTFLDHARNFVNAYIFSLEHKGKLETRNINLQWGFKWQNEYIADEITEWEMIDSAGYSIPYSSDEVNLDKTLLSENTISSERYMGYLSNIWQYNTDRGEYFFTSGIRANYWNLNGQLLFSPRLSLSFNPYRYRNMGFHVSSGVYYQPPFFKELRTPDGDINHDIKAQRSIHFILGSDILFAAWNRPFTFTAEAYYKTLHNLIPYKIDNVRIQYAGENRSEGYALGIDFKLNGEFVPGAESWASLSFMKTMENITDDYYFEEGLKRRPGYFPRPTNQLMNFSLFFQDYLPNNPDYKVNVTAHYGSRLPFTNPNIERYDVTYYMRPYKRIDLGFSKALLKHSRDSHHGNIAKYVKSLWLNAEIFNLFGFNNTSSYYWIRTISNLEGVPNQFAVPNFLTSRRFNIKISASF